MARESSTLSTLLKLVSRKRFDEFVQAHDGDKGSKGFSTWNQFVALVYGQLTGKRSLRELVSGFNSQEECHAQLSCKPIRRSTLSDANNKRSCEIYQSLLEHLMQQASRRTRRRDGELIEILDSTQIRLNQTLFAWAAKGHRLFGIKAHLVYGLEDECPRQLLVSNANVNDPVLIDDMSVKAGVTYLFDKGYCDFEGWRKILDQGGHFITRAKRNSAFRVVRSSQRTNKSILKDEIVEMASHNGRVLKGIKLRLVSLVDKEGRLYRLISDRINDSAEQLVSLYKKRWKIEIFFKWIKQNLKVKRFLGRSLNAVRTQITIALITYLLLKRFHEMSRSTMALCYFASEVCDRIMKPFRCKENSHDVAKYRPRKMPTKGLVL